MIEEGPTVRISPGLQPTVRATHRRSVEAATKLISSCCRCSPPNLAISTYVVIIIWFMSGSFGAAKIM